MELHFQHGDSHVVAPVGTGVDDVVADHCAGFEFGGHEVGEDFLDGVLVVEEEVEDFLGEAAGVRDLVLVFFAFDGHLERLLVPDDVEGKLPAQVAEGRSEFDVGAPVVVDVGDSGGHAVPVGGYAEGVEEVLLDERVEVVERVEVFLDLVDGVGDAHVMSPC